MIVVPVIFESTPAPPFFPLPTAPAPPPPPAPKVEAEPTPPINPAPLTPPFAVLVSPPKPGEAIMFANRDGLPFIPPIFGQLATRPAPPAPTATT